jgi:hypothetical protein
LPRSKLSLELTELRLHDYILRKRNGDLPDSAKLV